MKIFKKLTFRNFLATGDKTVEFDLDCGKLFLVNGKNGAGKSTIIDALSYVLFGSSHRPRATLSDLVNDKNGKNMLVTLELISNGSYYKICRGEKPKVLEIYKDGAKMPKLSSSSLVNQYIINTVIGQDRDLFFHLNVIGKSNYVPPLELSTPKQRDFIEKIFNIGILSKMKDILKELVKEDVKSKDDLSRKIEKKELEIKHAKELNKQISENLEKIKEGIRKEIKTLEEEIGKLEISHSEVDFDQEEYSTLKDKESKLVSEEKNLSRKTWKLENLSETLNAKILKIQEGPGECSECGQPLPEKDSEQELDDKKQELAECKKDISSNKELVEKNLNELKKVRKDMEGMLEGKSEKDSIMAQIKIQNRSLKDKKTELKKQEEINTDKHDVEGLETELEEFREEYEIFVERLEYFKYFKDDFLSDGGYKSYILSKHVPEINKVSNKLLSDYGLKYEILMENDFSAKIFNYKGKEVSYPRFSEGQKNRLNLSIWEAYLKVSSAQRNIQTNLIIFDEVLDGSLDVEGQEVLLYSLQEKMEKYNMTGFIISHGMDNFENQINVELVDGFSQYTFNTEEVLLYADTNT